MIRRTERSVIRGRPVMEDFFANCEEVLEPIVSSADERTRREDLMRKRFGTSVQLAGSLKTAVPCCLCCNNAVDFLLARTTWLFGGIMKCSDTTRQIFSRHIPRQVFGGRSGRLRPPSSGIVASGIRTMKHHEDKYPAV